MRKPNIVFILADDMGYGDFSAVNGGLSHTSTLEDNTIVMFTSDNGPKLDGRGENSLDRYNCHLHGAKGLVYEGGIRVPAILRWPGGLDGGREIADMVHFSDWFPTEPPRSLPDPFLPELYNIAEDPHEKENLADKHPDIVHRLLASQESPALWAGRFTSGTGGLVR